MATKTASILCSGLVALSSPVPHRYQFENFWSERVDLFVAWRRWSQSGSLVKVNVSYSIFSVTELTCFWGRGCYNIKTCIIDCLCVLLQDCYHPQPLPVRAGRTGLSPWSLVLCWSQRALSIRKHTLWTMTAADDHACIHAMLLVSKETGQFSLPLLDYFLCFIFQFGSYFCLLLIVEYLSRIVIHLFLCRFLSAVGKRNAVTKKK